MLEGHFSIGLRIRSLSVARSQVWCPVKSGRNSIYLAVLNAKLIYIHMYKVLKQNLLTNMPNLIVLSFGVAIKRPRTRSTAARQVSNVPERDPSLVTNQNV